MAQNNTPEITRENKGPFVAELTDKMSLESVFLVREKHFGTGKNGKNFLTMQLADRTGSVDARVWDNAEALQLILQVGDVVRVKGLIQTFQGRIQLIVHKAEKIDAKTIASDILVSASRRSAEDMESELLDLVEGLEAGPVRSLLLSTLAEPEVKSRLRTHPAAKTIHHAYRSGLLEHILSIAKLMNLIHAHYASDGIEMDRSLLVFGAIFHDIGKLWELEGEGPYGYTDRGRLLGHMAIAVELVERKSVEMREQGADEMTDRMKDKLKHIILSHHGRLEYGSPKEPMFLEAMIVAMVDDFDSKVNSMFHFIESERASGAEWSRVHPQLGRYLLLR
ncbi:MAG: OB-fold nucleic acid binding domain-containing protein [Bdellovibrionales bacterium]|jgi:3'-5' exoribonuclease|nr:OB-fold nucleic acid binding domain-containing protein [Bdellovibrionales bacterium]